jgi:hypothetical protein
MGSAFQGRKRGRAGWLLMQDDGDDAHLRELLELLQNDDSCSDEEGDGHARLLELAAQVASQPDAAARLSQALGRGVGPAQLFHANRGGTCSRWTLSQPHHDR